jgi:hypothetical protein
MRIEFTLTDDDGKSYRGAAELEVAAEKAGGAVLQSIAPPADSQTLPTRILALRDAGFFREPRTASEVHAKLLETYHCLLDRVQMALLRLQRKRELRKATKRVGEREHPAYVW